MKRDTQITIVLLRCQLVRVNGPFLLEIYLSDLKHKVGKILQLHDLGQTLGNLIRKICVSNEPALATQSLWYFVRRDSLDKEQ